jgi:hypothetical protein
VNKFEWKASPKAIHRICRFARLEGSTPLNYDPDLFVP